MNFMNSLGSGIAIMLILLCRVGFMAGMAGSVNQDDLWIGQMTSKEPPSSI